MDTKERKNETAYDREWFKKNADRIERETGFKTTLDYKHDTELKPKRYWKGLKQGSVKQA